MAFWSNASRQLRLHGGVLSLHRPPESDIFDFMQSRGDAGVFIARVATAAGAVSTDAVSRLHIHTIHRGPPHTHKRSRALPRRLRVTEAAR